MTENLPADTAHTRKFSVPLLKPFCAVERAFAEQEQRRTRRRGLSELRRGEEMRARHRHRWKSLGDRRRHFYFLSLYFQLSMMSPPI